MARMDRIELEGMTFRGRHGVRGAEREQLQEFTVDVDIESDLAAAAASDRIEDTVDYRRARTIAKEVIEGESASLLETLAARIANGVLDLQGVNAVSVRVAKRPPTMMPILSAAVHIRRTRE